MGFDSQHLQRFDSAEDAARFVAEQVVVACRDAITQRGAFHWVLAGGSTPALAYRMLRDADIDWSGVHVWFGDERALPKGHADRNETMARQALLDVVAIPPQNIHSIDFEASTEQSALSYAQLLAQVDSFDLVLLGMGEDGHTASLFPGNPALALTESAVPVFNSPKPPAERVSLSFDRLNRNRQAIILATGASKQPVLKALADGIDFPVNHINPSTWIVDQTAWPIA